MCIGAKELEEPFAGALEYGADGAWRNLQFGRHRIRTQLLQIIESHGDPLVVGKLRNGPLDRIGHFARMQYAAWSGNGRSVSLLMKNQFGHIQPAQSNPHMLAAPLLTAMRPNQIQKTCPRDFIQPMMKRTITAPLERPNIANRLDTDFLDQVVHRQDLPHIVRYLTLHPRTERFATIEQQQLQVGKITLDGVFDRQSFLVRHAWLLTLARKGCVKTGINFATKQLLTPDRSHPDTASPNSSRSMEAANWK